MEVRSEEKSMRLPFPGYWVLAAVAAAVFSAISLVGCSSSGNSPSTEPAASLGQPPKEDVPTVCTNCVSDEKIGQTLAVEGEIVQQCPASGCWFRLKDDAGEVFIDLAPAKLRLTDKRVGQHAKVTGRVAKEGGQLRLEAQHVVFAAAKKEPAPTGK
jgi:uncharacterized protein YdeI (BOF family)